MKQLNGNTTLRQWEKVTIDKKNRMKEMKNMATIRKKVWKKLQFNSSNVYVREMMEQLEMSFSEVCHQINTKPIHANEFKIDKNNSNTWVL